MKKTLLIFLALSFCLLLLVACDKGNETDHTSTDTAKAIAPVTDASTTTETVSNTDTSATTGETVEGATDVVTEIDTTPETAPPSQETQKEYESGEWPDACFVAFDSTKKISVGVGEVQNVIYIGFAFNADRYQADQQQGTEYYQIDVIVENPAVLEIVEVNKDKLMNYEIMDGGLTIKGLAPGETKVTLIMTYLPTGGTNSSSTTVTVTGPTE